MNYVELSKNDPRISHLVREYKGRRPIKVQAKVSCHISDYFDGGSRDYTSYLDLNTGAHLTSEQAGFRRQEASNPFHLDIGEVELRPGLGVLVNVIFCGKDLGYRLFVHESDLNRFQ